MKFVALLLFAASASAQNVIGPEVVLRATSQSPTYHPAAQAVPIVADGDGYLVTWSEAIDGLSRAYTGRLDAAGRLIRVGARTAGTADGAVIAPLGDRYVAAWLEPTGSDGRPGLVSALLDRSFQVASSHAADLLADAPRLRAGGGRVYVSTGSAIYELDASGGRTPVLFTPLPLDDFAVAGNEAGVPVAYVARSIDSFTSLVPPPYIITRLHFSWPLRTSGPLTATFELFSQRIGSPMAIGSDGSGFLVVWIDLNARAVMASLIAPLTQFQFSPFVVSSFASSRVVPDQQPQIASDGSRWLVVWEHEGRIEGMTVAPGGARTTFTVSDSGGARPSVATAQQGRFVVTYEAYEGVTRRLASRLLDFNPGPPPGRERAVR